MFTKALLDMFPLAKTILKGALQRDECRGAHFKPDFALPGLKPTDPAERRRQRPRSGATASTPTHAKWLKTTIAKCRPTASRSSATKMSTPRSSRRGRGCTAWSGPTYRRGLEGTQAAKTPATGGNGNGQPAGAPKVAIEK